jgi:phospholipid/cholesterol/gamma-HCH transport system substrate-binding protein
MNRAERAELKDVSLGLLVTAAILAVLAFVFVPGLGKGASSYDVNAEFARTDGLEIGSPVWAAGVPVGEVAAIELIEGFRVRTVLRIDRGIELDSDASAAIVTDGMFGAKLVRIDIGAGDNVIEDGGSIAFTEDALVLDDLLALIVSRARGAQAREQTESEQ